MQKAFIIIIMVIFIVSSIGFYIGMMGGAPQDPEQREQERRQEQAQPDIDDDEVEFEIPDYVRQAGVDYRGARDAVGEEQVNVVIGDNHFEPTALRVDAGTTVIWENDGEAVHTVSSNADSPESGLNSGDIAPGDRIMHESYSFTFEEPGEYQYLCEHHPASMRGVVIVTD